MRRILIIFFTALLLGAPGHAQNTVTSFSTSTHLGEAAAAACSAQRAVVAGLIDAFPHPAHWTWIVACDEASWDLLRQHTRRVDDSNYVVMALSNLDAQTTFVRAPSCCTLWTAPRSLSPTALSRMSFATSSCTVPMRSGWRRWRGTGFANESRRGWSPRCGKAVRATIGGLPRPAPHSL